MISTKYLPAACVLVAIALVPTLIHSYGTSDHDDGRSTASVPTALNGYISMPSDRNATWGQRRFDSTDWVERNYRHPALRDEVRLTIVRTFDAKSVYHHPELAVAYGTSFVGEDTQLARSHPHVPLHVLKPDVTTSGRALYALHYDDRFIADPIPFQIRMAGELLFSRRKPVTLFFVLDEQADAAQPIDEWPASNLLLAAVDAFVGPKK
jgi:hypothetical protein